MKLKRKTFSASDAPIFIQALCDLVGYEVKCKGLHWSSPSKNIHLYLDDLWEKLLDYIDSLAEGYMGVNGYLGPNDITATPYDYTNAKELIDGLCERLDQFHDSIPEGAKWTGIISITEDFIQVAYQYRYLFAMSDQEGEFGTPISGAYGDLEE